MNLIKRLNKVKTELVVLSILVPLVIVLGSLLIKWPDLGDKSEPAKEPKEYIIETSSNVSVVPKVEESTVPIQKELEEVTLQTSSAKYNKNWQVAIEGEVSVEKVLELAAAKGYLKVESIDYGGSMGVFIESLENIANNNIEKVYWHLYINDVLSPVGASHATVKAGDTVLWKYEKEQDEN
jgi:hypothetical protein